MSAAIWALPGRAHVAPLIESDYCYLLTAVDRAMAGHGFTAPQPVAPFQPWEWRGDWEFITHWPVGYSAVLFALRRILGWSTLDAERFVGVVATSAGLVGWFTWLRMNLPRGAAAMLLAFVGAASGVSVGTLVNPSTDVIVTAALPYLLMALRCVGAHGASTKAEDQPTSSSQARHLVKLATVGLLAGSLFWIRYAAIFVPAGCAAYLLLRKSRSIASRFREFVAFAAGAALLIGALLALNAWLGASDSLHSRLNLGNRVSIALSWDLLLGAWRGFTSLGFYDYHETSRVLFALWPLFLAIVIVVIPAARARVREFASQPGVRMSIALVGSLLALLIVATGCFGAKFNYVGLDRYYVPVRPLYFLLFVGPVLLVPRPAFRALAALLLLVAMHWTLLHQWPRDYARACSTDRQATRYGEWSRCFEPRAREVFGAVTALGQPEVFLVSNFPEYITLETGLPCAPIPASPAALCHWLQRASSDRSAVRQVVFVLDPSPRWRAHWIPPTETIISEFGLKPVPSFRWEDGTRRLFAFSFSLESVPKYGTCW